MSVIERVLLAIAILEIPLQIDKYLFYQERHGDIGAIGGLNVSLLTFAMAGLYSMWLTKAALRMRQERARVVWGIPLLFYLAVVGLSSVTAEKRILTFFETALLAQAYLLFLYIANRLRSRSDLVFVLSLMGLTLIIEGAIIAGTFRMGGPSEISVGMIRILIDESGRHSGTFAAPVLAGSFLAFLMVPAASLLFVPVSMPVKVLSLLAVAMGAFSVMLTQSRGAIITMFVASLVFGTAMLLRGWLPKWTPVAALLIAACVAVPMVQVVRSRVLEGDDGSAESRVYLSQIAWDVITDHPVLGVGASNCHLAMRRIADEGRFRSEWFHTVHCKYLLVWVETGLLGLIAFLGFLLSTIAQGWRVWLCGDRLYSTVALGLVAAILGQMVHMGVDIFNGRQMVQILWCFAGIIAAIASVREVEAAPQSVTDELPSRLVTAEAA